ncbi:MAG: ABC transporter substrate-binding protein [Firmicutes bacterium]|jgi:branched-chain amino acid transport system substrate-binding protein|nr:ABC transporter substrate-binding protein [Bacillota bacterium]
MKRSLVRLAIMLPVLALVFGLLAVPILGKVDTVKVGVIYPLTGSAAATGKDYIAAYQLAADIVNNKMDLDFPFARTEGIPALGGAMIEIVPADSQGSPEVGRAEAERLISSVKPTALMGCHHSAVTKTASQAAERFGTVFLCPDSTSPALTERGYEWFFRSGPTDTTFIEDTFDFIEDLKKARGLKVETVAIVSEDTEFGKNISVVEEQMAATRGYRVVEKITFQNNSTNVNSEVLRLKRANPDVILMAAYTSDTILFVRTFKEQKYTPPAVIGQRAGFISPEIFTTLGKDADYLFTTNVWAPDLGEKRPIVKRINELYRAKTGKDLTGDYARAFTGAFILVDAINRAGSVNPEAIRKALLATDYPGSQLIVPWAGVRFDQKTHQNTLGRGIITQAIGGVYRTVWPFDLASQEAVWPVPAWDKR